MNKSSFVILFLLIYISFLGCSQNQIKKDTVKFNFDTLQFINIQKNKFLFAENNLQLKSFYEEFKQTIDDKKEKMSILHIGDSHIQANISTNQIRNKFSEAFNLKVGRGIMFPHWIAKTNNAADISTPFTGNWQRCRNIDNEQDCNLGLTGYSVTTNDEEAHFYFKYWNDSLAFAEKFKVRVWFKTNQNYEITIEDNKASNYDFELENDLVIAEFEFNPIQKDSICFKLKKTDKSAMPFTLYGFEIQKPSELINYHSVGVNGAEVKSWNVTSQLISELGIIHPKLIIISLGANDGYKKEFNEKEFADNYLTLIKNIQSILPESAIILVPSGDSYLYGKQSNPNNDKIQRIIYDLARKENCIVWDFYEIMGGLNSIKQWQKHSLSSDDLLHFSPKGYVLQGDLFFNAFMLEFEKYLKKQ